MDFKFKIGQIIRFIIYGDMKIITRWKRKRKRPLTGLINYYELVYECDFKCECEAGRLMWTEVFTEKELIQDQDLFY